jgi:hypothetical protein
MTKYLLLFFSTIIGAWLLYDGAFALITGSYTTPASGAYAGQLGPWSHLLITVGINPLSLAIKLLHILLGASWMLFGILFLLKPCLGRLPLLATAILSLWYAPFGTVIGLFVAIILLYTQKRSAM